MRTYVTLLPEAEHAPVGKMSGARSDTPLVNLDKEYGRVTIQFDPSTPDATIAYLTTLVAEASKLLEAVKAREVQS